MRVSFEFEKETKNTIRFKEVLDGPLDVPKQTLKQIGYKEGNKLIVELKSE